MDLKFDTRGFLGSLIANPSSKLTNTKWRIQYDRRKWKKLLVSADILYLGLFGVADYESKLKIKKFEIADLIWQTKMQNLLDWDDILYAGVFGVADYRSMLKISKFIRTDLIWRIKMQKVDRLGWNLVLREFWGRWLWIWVWNSEIKNGGSKMADQNAQLLDLDEIWYSEVCRSLITNSSSKFRNSKWRIQYGVK